MLFLCICLCFLVFCVSLDHFIFVLFAATVFGLVKS